MGLWYQRFVWLLGACILTSSCGDETVNGMPDLPTTADIQALVFDKACSQGGCHDVDGAGGLVLTDVDTSREQLLEAVAENETARNSGLLRVVPGRPAESFLIRKITAPTLGEGLPMPIENPNKKRLTDKV